MDELLEFSELQEKTNVAAEELESAFMEIQQNHMLSKREVLFTLARVVDSFIRLEGTRQLIFTLKICRFKIICVPLQR